MSQVWLHFQIWPPTAEVHAAADSLTEQKTHNVLVLFRDNSWYLWVIYLHYFAFYYCTVTHPKYKYCTIKLLQLWLWHNSTYTAVKKLCSCFSSSCCFKQNFSHLFFNPLALTLSRDLNCLQKVFSTVCCLVVLALEVSWTQPIAWIVNSVMAEMKHAWITNTVRQE